MRRFTIGSAIMLALLLMLTAIAASAVPDDFCYEGRVHPQCPTTTTATTSPTTTAPELPTLEPCPTEAFPIPPKPGRVDFECLWTPVEPDPMLEGEVEGKVKVAPTAGISKLVVFVRDEAPGDICLDAMEYQADDDSFVGSFDLSYGDPLASHEDWEDSYPVIFEKYENQTYWSFNHFDKEGQSGTHWCYPQDGPQGMRPDLNGPPLHLWVHFLANKDASPVVVTLSVETKP